jgi:hypothetical protein
VSISGVPPFVLANLPYLEGYFFLQTESPCFFSEAGGFSGFCAKLVLYHSGESPDKSGTKFFVSALQIVMIQV